MTHVNLIDFANSDSTNYGIAREWAACRYFGIQRKTHDKTPYYEGSDIELSDGRNISVKAGEWSLMSGRLCEGCKTFEGIWRRYYRNTHSNLFMYVTEDWQGYIMTKKEFSKFVHRFCTLGRESSKNGGGIKIRCYKETKAKREWLATMCS